MTALEHLVSVYAEHHNIPPPLDATRFATIVRPALVHAYDQLTIPDAPDKITRVRERIASLNQTTFKDRLGAMLAAYNVPLIGIEDRIKPAIDARNKIIHTGRHAQEFKDLYLHVAVLRELLKRIILTLLQYKGQYISFLNGQEFLEFPPTNVSVHE